MKRPPLTVVTCVMVCLGGLAAHTSGPARQVSQAWNHARASVGSAKTNVKSLVLYGSCLAGFNGVTAQPLDRPKSLEIRLLLPDYYERIDKDASEIVKNGFRKDEPFLVVEPIGRSVSVGSRPPGPDVTVLHRLYVTRLLLGMVADARGVLPLEVRGSTARAGEDVVSLAGPDGFSAFVDVDRASGLPLRVRYMDDVRYPEPLSDDDRKAGRMPGPWNVERAEVTITFGDRRTVSGLQIPFWIKTTALGRRFEEIRLDRVVVNPPLSPSGFSK
jgi:hypothetical protein